MRIIVHNGTGQPRACLESLQMLAQLVAQSPRAQEFRTGAEIQQWLLKQPIKYDEDDGPPLPGCEPMQRSRVWPANGLNCWEATGHYVGVMQRLDPPIEVHVYDLVIDGQRHVWPALRVEGAQGVPDPVILQLPGRAPAQALLKLASAAPFSQAAQGWLTAMGGPKAQQVTASAPPASSTPQAAKNDEWWNHLIGGVHVIGGIAATAFGGGALVPVFERLESPVLPEWAKYTTRGASTPPTVGAPSPNQQVLASASNPTLSPQVAPFASSAPNVTNSDPTKWNADQYLAAARAIT